MCIGRCKHTSIPIHINRHWHRSMAGPCKGEGADMCTCMRTEMCRHAHVSSAFNCTAEGQCGVCARIFEHSNYACIRVAAAHDTFGYARDVHTYAEMHVCKHVTGHCHRHAWRYMYRHVHRLVRTRLYNNVASYVHVCSQDTRSAEASFRAHPHRSAALYGGVHKRTCCGL